MGRRAPFLKHDKVIQTRNNYDLNVMNGAIGNVVDVLANGTLVIDFDGMQVELEKGSPDLQDLQLAYALTIHKTQGSEFPCAVVVVLSRVLGPRGRQVYADLIRDTPEDPAVSELDTLSADADEATRQGLAERLAPYIRSVRQAHPGLTEARADAPRGANFAEKAIDDAMADLYNPAQLDVLRRAGQLVRWLAT